MYKPFTMLIAALGLTLTAGCGSSYGDLCAAAIQCEGGNDQDVDACIANSNGAEDVAAAYDCGDAYFKLSECIDKTNTCDNKHFRASCNDEASALNKCEEAASGQ